MLAGSGLRTGATAAAPAQPQTAPAAEPLRVVATTADLGSLVQAVGGERVAVHVLVPAFMDAEEFTPRPQDAARVADAQLLVRVGLDYDLWVDRLARRARQASQLDASRGITLLDVRAGGLADTGHAHGAGNPHYWLDWRNAEPITAQILLALAEMEPARSAAFEQRRSKFLVQLASQADIWAARLAPLRGRAVVCYHSAWPYLARRLQLDVAAVIEPRPGVPPSPGHLAAVVRTARERRAAAVLLGAREPRRQAEYVARHAGLPIAVLAASVADVAGAAGYADLFEFNVRALERVAA